MKRALLFVLLLTSFASAEPLDHAIASRLMRVPELSFLREAARELGVRVWLFGGTAAGFGHYVRWDDASPRFDYDFTNIYRSTQDLDIVVDGTAEQAAKLEELLREKFNHIVGSKTAWEVRLLREKRGDKEALLANDDFLLQHTDSNSTGMIEVSVPPPAAAGQNVEPVVRDLRDWQSARPIFLTDLEEGKLHYYFSPRHGETSRARAGLNPPIVSVVRYLTKAFQYALELRPEDVAKIRKIIDAFDGKPGNTYVAGWLEKNGRKLIQHAVDVEYAVRTLDALGLREKLAGDAVTLDSLAWWMRKEPLRSKPLGASGKSARELGIDVVAHETRDYLAYEAITRSTKNIPNVLISRSDFPGEAAAYGDGFYTRRGREGARGTGMTIRFRVDPEAREGADFTVHDDYVILKNRTALTVIPEAMNLELDEYFMMLREGRGFDRTDLGILERLKRRVRNKLGAIGPEERGRLMDLLAGDGVKNPRHMLAIESWLASELSRKVPETARLIHRLTDTDGWRGQFLAGLLYLSKPWESVLLRDPYLLHAFRLEWLKLPFDHLKEATPLDDDFFEALAFGYNPVDNPFLIHAVHGNPTEAFETLMHLFRNEAKLGGETMFIRLERHFIVTLARAIERAMETNPAILQILSPHINEALEDPNAGPDLVKYLLSAPVLARAESFEGWLRYEIGRSDAGAALVVERVLTRPHVIKLPYWRGLIDLALKRKLDPIGYKILHLKPVVERADWPELVKQCIQRPYPTSHATSPVLSSLMFAEPMARPEWIDLMGMLFETELARADKEYVRPTAVFDTLKSERLMADPRWAELMKRAIRVPRRPILKWDIAIDILSKPEIMKRPDFAELVDELILSGWHDEDARYLLAGSLAKWSDNPRSPLWRKALKAPRAQRPNLLRRSCAAVLAG